MEPLKAEIDAVIEVLTSGWESPEAGAEAVIRALDEARTNRTTYGIVVNARPAPYIYREFGNRQEALNWAKKQGLDVVGLAIWVVPMRSKNLVQKRHQTEAHRKLMNDKTTGAAPSTNSRSRSATPSSASEATSGKPSKRRARGTRGRSTKTTDA